MSDNILQLILSLGGFTLILMIFGYFAKKYLLGFVNADPERKKIIQQFAYAIDAITDEIVLSNEKNVWLKYLDKVVDKLIESCDLKDYDDLKKMKK